MGDWWDKQVAQTGQGLYSDPTTAMQVATMPYQLLSNEQQVTQQEELEARGGFMDSIMGAMSDAGTFVDEGLSKYVTGWGVTKNVASFLGSAAWYPVDKAASAMHWAYSEGVSQPLATAFLLAGESELNPDGTLRERTLTSGFENLGVFFKGEEWSKAYEEAENLSPAQAYFNTAATTGALGSSLGRGDMTDEEVQSALRLNDRLMYDTEYWRDKSGWKYDVGTGVSDFALVLFADPTYAAFKVGAKVVQGARTVTLGTERAEEVVNSSKALNELMDWSAGRSAQEIAQHPMWGPGRRRQNEARYQLSEILANSSREEMPLVFRYAGGDVQALEGLTAINKNLVSQFGKANDNRTFLQSFRADADQLAYFTKEAAGPVGPRTAKGKGAAPIGPRPTVAGPEQEAWDALNRQAETYRGIVSDIATAKATGAGPLVSATYKTRRGVTTNPTNLRMARKWQEEQLKLASISVDDLASKNVAFGNLLKGAADRTIDDFSPGEANLFGVFKDVYRPTASKVAEKRIARINAPRGAAGRDIGGNFVMKTIRTGYYNGPVRVIQAFGDRTPQGFVNHNDVDATDRVVDMLKQVKGLKAEQRQALINAYSVAPTKIEKSAALDFINGEVLSHMGRFHANLDDDAVALLRDFTDKKISEVLGKTKSGPPGSQVFSSATDPALEGRRVDKFDDGESIVILPLAKTQLSMADPMLPIRELERFLTRSSGVFAPAKKIAGGQADAFLDVADSLNTAWKFTTLMRPGYTPRTLSDEVVLRAVKFGALTVGADAAEGAWNFARNRATWAKAYVGKGSYVPGTGKGAESKRALIMIEDSAAKAAADKLGLPTGRVRMHKMWPKVQGMLLAENKAATNTSKELASIQKEWASYQVKYGTGASQLKKGKWLESEVTRVQGEFDDHTRVVSEFADYADEMLRQSVEGMGRRSGEGTYMYRGQEIKRAFSREWTNPIERSQISSESANAAIFSRMEAIGTARLIKTGSWVSKTSGQAGYMDDWLHVLNHQFAQDDVFRMVAEDPTLAKATTWLKTAAGKDHLLSLGRANQKPDEFARAVKLAMDDVLPEGTGLQAKIAAQQDLTAAELHGAMSVDDFPLVNSEETMYLTKMFSKQTATRRVDDIVAEGYRVMATIPTDVLSRQPLYLRAQEGRMRSLVDDELAHYESVGRPSDSISADAWNAMLEKSDKMARKDISQVAYDPQRTTATEALRFVAPFFSAHADSLQRWGGMIAEKPELIPGIARIYNAPVSAGIVTDEQGNSVGKDGYVEIHDPTTGEFIERKFVTMEERVLNFRVPGETTNLKNGMKVPSGGVPIKISAINTLLPGDPWFNPGGGPVVQLTGSAIAKASPTMGDFLQWSKVLPYGPQGIAESITPKYMRAAYDAWTTEDPGNEKFQAAYAAVYNRQLAEYHNGGDAPDFKKVEGEAKQFMMLQMLTAWASPAQTRQTPLTGTPYQFFVDQYKQLQDVDPENAKDLFLAKYGPDYFHFSTSLSKSMGIAPTVTADGFAEEYRDLIDKDPDMAAFLTMSWKNGTLNSEEFSSSVYAKQQEQILGGEAVRSKISAREAIANNEKDLGWTQFKMAMTVLDATLARAGFRSYQDSGAEGLAQMKRDATSQIGAAYPGWEQAFSVVDRGKIPRRIASFANLVGNEKLANDPMRQDIPVLREYLEIRSGFKSTLKARGLQALSFDTFGNPSGEAADLGYAWRAEQTRMKLSNLKFGDVFTRYLENDDLQ